MSEEKQAPIEEKTEELVDDNKTHEEQFELVFRNGALSNLKSLARNFDVPEDNLKEIVNKAVKLLTFVKDSDSILFKDASGTHFRVDVKKL